MNDPSALDYWTLAIAVVGAATGVAALAAQVWSFALSGPRIKVAVASSFSSDADGWFLTLEVLNVGRMPVTLAEQGIAFGRKKKIPTGLMGMGVVRAGPPGGHRLVDGESASWVMTPGPLAHKVQHLGSRKVHGYVRLATGKVVTSRNSVDIVALANLT